MFFYMYKKSENISLIRGTYISGERKVGGKRNAYIYMCVVCCVCLKKKKVGNVLLFAQKLPNPHPPPGAINQSINQ